MLELKTYLVVIASLALLGCGKWSVLEPLGTAVSPDKKTYSHSVRMGAGGAAGSTETRIILSQTGMIKDTLPSDTVTLTRTGFGCNEMIWIDEQNLEIRHCTQRSRVKSIKTVDLNGKKIRVSVKYATNCDPNAFTYPTPTEKLKRICEKMTYTK